MGVTGAGFGAQNERGQRMIEVTDAMRRAVLAPCYQCDECMDGYSDCTCYPADMIGYVAGTGRWVCSICIGENASEILELVKWDDDDEPVYKHEWGGWPDDKPPTPLYVCSWEDCGEDSCCRRRICDGLTWRMNRSVGWLFYCEVSCTGHYIVGWRTCWRLWRGRNEQEQHSRALQGWP